MKKRIPWLILSVSLLLMLSVPALADGQNVVPVSTPEELAALDGQKGAYVLVCDIDLAGIDWTPIDFYGTLDGGFHTVCNLSVTRPGSTSANTIDGNDVLYETALCGLFGRVEKADIFNLTIQGADIVIDTDKNCFVGGLAGFSRGSLLKNITLKDSRLSLTAGGTMVGIGGIVGYGNGTVMGATVKDSPMIFTDKNNDRRCEMFLAGVLGCGNSIIDNCVVDMDGYAACNGYVHSGGLVGMFYQYDKDMDVGSVANSTVTGKISFYENNPDRRAYCQAYVGEPLTEVWPNYCEESFVRDETFNISRTMSPETCAEPEYEEHTVPGSCTEWGYTEHVCKGCGYTYRDSFVVPAHSPGHWRFVNAPTYDAPGTEELRCSVCREVLETRETPTLVPVSEIRLSGDVALFKDEEADISCAVSPGNAEDRGVTWSSSAPAVVSVDQNGHIRALDRGSAVITCASNDGFVKSRVNVTVELTKKQTVLYYLTFQWFRLG